MGSDYKNLLVYDIIIPKANKAEEFAPLIEIAEKELENFEEEETNGLNEEEYKQFVQDVYEQTLLNIVNEGDDSDGEIKDYQETVIIENESSKVPIRPLKIIDNFGSFEKLTDEAKRLLERGNKNTRIRIFQNPFCYLSIT